MTPLETYLRTVSEIHASGAAVKETSYYPPLSNLLNEVGKKLKPRVRCIMSLANRGAGLPDGGLFTSDQFPRTSKPEPLEGQIPSRGVIEVKSPSQDVGVTASGEQVSRYWNRYKQVLVTNLGDFVLVGRDAEGKAVKLETYRLAETEKAFWSAATPPRKTDQEHGERFVEFLQRVLLHAAPLGAPEDVAWFLASYAREAKARIEGVDLPALASVRSALEEALGLQFQGEKGEHFFRSSLVQTLFYGVFSAWVLWSKAHPTALRERFDWNSAARYLRVPMISKLFYLVADPNQLDALKLSEVLDWTAQVLNRIDRRSFFDRFQETHAVQYFYEPFLEVFDPELRKQLGVWYTPPEVVKYMVERVDTVLREELRLPLGLADKNVYVLDPCCGTGSYLVEVLDRIHRTLKEKGEDGLLASDLKDAARNRIFGFEILPAPFVVSHLQLGLFLQNLGAPLSEAKKERAGVYLTNALTGWEPPKGPKQHLIFPELEEERDAAERVKREVPILVILGNPPYNAFAGVSPEEEQGLVAPYKQGLISEWGIRKFNLDDLYIRFFRLAERRIVEGRPGRGAVCYISNFSYLGDPSFVVMRRRFLTEFDRLWFDCMNGDSRETGKLMPEGTPDPSVFSTERNREGIRLGTAIGLFIRVGARSASQSGFGLATSVPEVRFRDFWGATKRQDLLRSLEVEDFNEQYRTPKPSEINRYSFRPSGASSHYEDWPKLPKLSAESPISGLQEMRHGGLLDIDADVLEARMRAYFDETMDWGEFRRSGLGLAEKAGGFDPVTCRTKALGLEKFDASKIQRYALYPMDVRWCYYTTVPTLWNRPRPELTAQRWNGNAFIIVRMVAERPREHVPITFTSVLPDYHLLRPNAVAIPIRLRPASPPQQGILHDSLSEQPITANLSDVSREYLSKLGLSDPDSDAETSGLVWMHALAIAYSPAYLVENRDGIRQNWPRIPLPDSKELLLGSAELGRQIAALLDTETPAQVTQESSLQGIAAYRLVEQEELDESKHFALTTGWGHAGKDGVTMPGKGRMVERDYTAQERESMGETVKLLGERTLDVYLTSRTS